MVSTSEPHGYGQSTYPSAYHQPIEQQEITPLPDNQQPYMSHQQSYDQLVYQESMYQDTKYQSGGYNDSTSPQPFANDTVPATYYTAPRRSFYHKTVRAAVRMTEWWAPEIASFLIAGGLFGIYWHLLNVFKDQPLAHWQDVRGVSSVFTTLPSAIAFLTTLMRGAMVFPVASAIGQWKWHQYARKPSRLVEFERYDKASRGIVGSIGFILSRNFWSPATIGCVITIASVFFGPFLQNTVTQDLWSERMDNETAYLPVTGSYQGVRFMADRKDDPRYIFAPSTIQSTMGRAWFFAEGQEKGTSDMSNHLHAECPTNECSWDSFSTLVMVHACSAADFEVEDMSVNNVTRKVAFSAAANLSTIYNAVEEGNTTAGHPTLLQTTISRNVPEASFFAELKETYAIQAHMGFIGDFGGDGSAFEAVECILYWAANQGHANYTNGNLTNTLLVGAVERTDPGAPPTDDFANVTIRADWPCNFNTSTTEASEDGTCDYTIAATAQHGMYNSLAPFLANGWSVGVWDEHPDDGEDVFALSSSHLSTEIFFWTWDQDRGHEEAPDQESLLRTANLYIGNMAYFLSAAVRNISPDVEMNFGHVSAPVVHFKVDRMYLILPGAILALSVIFFAFAVIWTWNEKAWRNSQLPLFFHGLATTGHHEWDAMNMSSMWEAAYDTKVKLESGDGGPGRRLQRYRDEMGQPLTSYVGVSEGGHVGEETHGLAHKGTWGTTWSTVKV